MRTSLTSSLGGFSSCLHPSRELGRRHTTVRGFCVLAAWRSASSVAGRRSRPQILKRGKARSREVTGRKRAVLRGSSVGSTGTGGTAGGALYHLKLQRCSLRRDHQWMLFVGAFVKASLLSFAGAAPSRTPPSASMAGMSPPRARGRDVPAYLVAPSVSVSSARARARLSGTSGASRMRGLLRARAGATLGGAVGRAAASSPPRARGRDGHRPWHA